MKREIINQLALNTNLLSASVSASIQAGDEPPLHEIVMHLLITVMDAEAFTAVDPLVLLCYKFLMRIEIAPPGGIVKLE
jgi:hypothetical protein